MKKMIILNYPALNLKRQPPPFPIMITCVDCGGSRVAQSLPSKYCVLCHVCTLLDDEV